MKIRRFLQLTGAGLAATALPASASAAAGASPLLPDSVRQLVVGLADDWSSSRGKLYLFSRSGPGSAWRADSAAPLPILFGRNGLAWGNGALPVPHGQPGVPSKRERDKRAPAGCFRIGTLYSHVPAPPPGVSMPYYRVTARDCWIDDPAHPAYNRHVTVDLANPPPWYEKQRMRLGDFAYEFLLEVRHNADPPVPGHGSAIFFHLRRGPDTPSAGCTTMARPDMLTMLRWLHPGANPHYVCLPRAEYSARISTWGLPALR